jgi:hypothetical protein
MPTMAVAMVVIAAKVASVRLEGATFVGAAAMEAAVASESTACESAAMEAAVASESTACESAASVEAAAAPYKRAAAKPAAAPAMAAASAATAARIGANCRQRQSADHEDSSKGSFDRCTHDNLSFSAHQHCRCSRQN